MKTIYTDTHILLVDEATEIKDARPHKDKWHLEKDSIINKFPNYLTDLSECKLIIASSPKLEGVDEFETLPPNITPNCEELAENYSKRGDSNERRQIFKIGYRDGYRQAKSEPFFSLDDMKTAIRWGCNKTHLKNNEIEQFIQSLTKPKQYEFIVEWEIVCDDNNYGNGEVFHENRKEIPKIVNGKIQGTWKEI